MGRSSIRASPGITRCPIKVRPRARSAMTDTPRLSDRPDNKLQAVLNHNRRDSDDYLGADYGLACVEWFADLSARDRAIAARAIEAYASVRDIGRADRRRAAGRAALPAGARRRLVRRDLIRRDS